MDGRNDKEQSSSSLDDTEVASEGVPAGTIRRRSRRTSSTAVRKANKQNTVSTSPPKTISPDLLRWIESTTTAGSTTTDRGIDASKIQQSRDNISRAISTTNDEDNYDGAGDGGGRKRRERQAIRIALEQARRERLQTLIFRLERALGIVEEEDDAAAEKDNSIPSSFTNAKSNKEKGVIRIQDLLQVLRQILDETQSTSDGTASSTNSAIAPLRALVAGTSTNSQGYNYRLAWVGSDDAICHVGTSLHKVPLARLQEVFLSFPGRNRVTLQEVIRVLGPFPNVKNTLQGSCSYHRARSDDTGSADWTITWESMTDGTGKEILAGTKENTRRVELQVHVADPTILVASVPPPTPLSSSETSTPTKQLLDPLRENGKYLLLFLREEDIDSKLMSLRVA